MEYGVDYSGGRPGGAALRAAGKTFAIRYIAHSIAEYNLTLAEVADLTARGLSIVIVCERGTQRALGGQAAGAFDAKLALSTANALGLPPDRPIYFAVDWNMQRDQESAVQAYFAGVASVIGLARTGIYGGLSAVQHAQAGKWATWFWQTYAWSLGIWASGVHIRQYLNGQSIGGAAVDFDMALMADFGQWPASGGDMAPSQKNAGPVLGTVKWANWTPANALIAPDLSWKSSNRHADEILNVVGIFDLVDAKGTPIDIEGNQPPKLGRDQVYLIDGTTAQPVFGAAAYMLRQDATPLLTPPPDCTAQITAATQAATSAARTTIAIAIAKLQEV